MTLHHPDFTFMKQYRATMAQKTCLHLLKLSPLKLLKRWEKKERLISSSSHVNGWVMMIVDLRGVCTLLLAVDWWTYREWKRTGCLESALIRCGVAIWRSAMWECVKGQRCCHGDRLQWSVLKVGVTECESAYPTSTLIFTASGQRDNIWPAVGAWEQLPPFHSSEARACKGSRLEKQRVAWGFQAYWEDGLDLA